jgi:hypothetical protein
MLLDRAPYLVQVRIDHAERILQLQAKAVSRFMIC